MRPPVTLLLIGTGLLAAPFGLAQPPGGGGASQPQATAGASLVDRMMAFDTDKDDKLTKSEVTDARLKRLFDQADADKDGLVTRSELNALMVRERASARGKMAGGGGPGGRMGFGGPGGPRASAARPAPARSCRRCFAASSHFRPSRKRRSTPFRKTSTRSCRKS